MLPKAERGTSTKLRILWLTNHVLPDHAQILGLPVSPRGGWMPALAEALVESGRVILGVATSISGMTWRQDDIKGVTYFCVPMPSGCFQNGRIPKALIQNFQCAEKDFLPDVIHIHGTESSHGLLTGRGHLKAPAIISIQGLLDVCQHRYLDGLTFLDLLKTRTLRDWIRLDGLYERHRRIRRQSRVEREIFACNAAFIGRTTWDRAHTRRLAPRARYYHCDELIREQFFEQEWNPAKIQRHSLFASSASYPLKGFHVLVKAVALLRREFPDVTLRTPLANLYPNMSGVNRFLKDCRVGGYSRYLNKLIRGSGLENHVFPLSNLDALGMANELLRAHVFALPSLIENSPNSLAEAMLVGTPSVASFVGGVPSMVQDGETALLSPPGDEAVLAEQIRRIFLDQQLASKLSSKARNIARKRHSKTEIVARMLEIYRRESGDKGPVELSKREIVEEPAS